MARVYDLWTKKNPDKSDGAPKRIRTARWGIGKRRHARWHEDGTRRSARDRGTSQSQRHRRSPARTVHGIVGAVGFS